MGCGGRSGRQSFERYNFHKYLRRAKLSYINKTILPRKCNTHSPFVITCPLTSTQAYPSHSCPIRSHPVSGYLRCTGKVSPTRMCACCLSPSISRLGMPSRTLKLTRCCPDTEAGSSTSIGAPPYVSMPILRVEGYAEIRSKSCRACCFARQNTS